MIKSDNFQPESNYDQWFLEQFLLDYDQDIKDKFKVISQHYERPTAMVMEMVIEQDYDFDTAIIHLWGGLCE